MIGIGRRKEPKSRKLWKIKMSPSLLIHMLGSLRGSVSSVTSPITVLMSVPLKKVVHLVEREEGEDNKVYCGPDGDEEYEKDNEDEEEGQNYIVRRLMLAPKQEDNTQRHQLF